MPTADVRRKRGVNSATVYNCKDNFDGNAQVEEAVRRSDAGQQYAHGSQHRYW